MEEFDFSAESFPRNLRRVRKEKGLTQIDVAARLSINQGHYSGYEVGTKNPSFGMLLEIMTALDCEPNDLFRRAAG